MNGPLPTLASYIEFISKLIIPTAIIDDIGFVLCQLEKRSPPQSIYLADKKRKLRRKEEQRSKNAKKKRCIKPSCAEEFYVESDDSTNKVAQSDE